MKLSNELVNKINKLVETYPHKRGSLLPVLYLVQEEYGFLEESALKDVASILSIPEVYVFSTATFYTMFRTKPQCENVVSVCTNITCSLLGSEHIVKTLENILRDDKRFSLRLVECLGSCGTAPVMMINGELYENLTEEKVKEIIEKWRE